jgi:glycosyltransferase involved in cell wall biosynthesis
VKIVHIGTNDVVGGAARAAYRLHDGLQRLGQDSTMFVAAKFSQDPAVIQFEPSKHWGPRFLRTLRRAEITLDASRSASPAGHSIFSDDRSVYSAEPWRQRLRADLIQLHWVATFVDYRPFFQTLPGSVPLVWTLHDMNPFTGGCHYDGGCARFIEQCGRCPQLDSRRQNDLSNKIWRRKLQALRILAPERLHVVTPSKWLGQQVSQSSLLSRFPSSVIPYGLDTEVFQPRNPLVMREALGISTQARVVLFIADSTNDPRKGFKLLASALEDFESNFDIVLLSVGHGKPLQFSRFPHVHVETIQDDRLLSFIYSCADVFVVPSLQDNLPNTILESIACGTPVVGFRAGGIPDVILDGETGLLAAKGSVEDLHRGVLELLKNPKRRDDMSRNCRRLALESYSIGMQAFRYLQLYTELTSKREDSRSPSE